LTKLLFGSLNILLYHHTSVKIGVYVLLTQAPAQICLIIFFISVTTFIRNSHTKIISSIMLLDEYDFFIGSHKRSQRDERLYTDKVLRQDISGI